MRSVRYGCMRTRSHSPGPSGPALSQIEFEIPSRPRSCASPARRSVRTSASVSPSCAPATAARSATACACPSVYGDLRSTKFAIASSAASNRSSGSSTASAGSDSMTASHVETASRSERIASASAPISAASSGSNCLPPRFRASSFAAATPPTRCATSVNSASCASLAASGTSAPLRSPGQPRPSHCS